MAETLLSESLMESSASSKNLRDPFMQARNSYESKQSQGTDSTVLSSSPFSPPADPAVESLGQSIKPDFSSMLKGMGIDNKGISFDQVGKVNFLGRLKSKFGEQYLSNPSAVEALKFFDENMQNQTPEQTKQMNKTLTNAQRTIGALFGGS